jgi:hypothetical protein
MSENTTGDVFGESLSPAEQAYFSSKGSDAAGLASEAPEPTSAPITQDDAAPAPQADTDLDVGEVYLDESGKARSVVTGKFVPHGAFHQERERRKATEAELMSARERMARADERLAVLNDILSASESPAQEKKAEEAPPPDPETDIFGYVKWQAQKIQELEESRKQETTQREQARLASEVQNYYRNDAMNFMKEVPDFADAYNHVAQSFATELRARGLNDQQIQQQLMSEEAQIAYQCKVRGTSPSRVIYEMAKARGYQGKGAAPITQQAAPSEAAQKKIATMQQAQKASVSLSGAGSSGGEGLTIEALANMSDDEFASVSARLGKHKMRQLLGG